MQHVYAFGGITGFAASVIFIVAFILTLWPGRRRMATAAALYATGMITSMAFFVYYASAFVWMAYGMSDTGSPNRIAFVGLLWPVWAIGYTVGAIALLWPSISQEKALRYGKILHLVVGLPPAMWIGIRPLSSFASAFGVGWLVYALLWFRIRESYPNLLSSRSVEPFN